MKKARFALFLYFVFSIPVSFSGELERHTLNVDGHPFAVWEKTAENAAEAILLVHGRTWSSLPDFDLQVEGEDLSLMDSLVDAGYAVYAVDLRGYGETPRDATGWLTPSRAAKDVAGVLDWIDEQRDWSNTPHLFGWSMGATVSHLAAQTYPESVGSLTLYGFWHDLDDRLPADTDDLEPRRLTNTAEAAASDFITPGSISQRAIDGFVAAALKADPVKTDIRGLSDYNALDPSLLTMPTLVIVGEFDPIAPQARQLKLFARIGTGHKQYVSVPRGDHAAHLENTRNIFINELVTFLRGSNL